MGSHRGILTLVTLVVLGAAGALVGWYWVFLPAADPRTASLDQILRLLVLRDVQAEPVEWQLALVDRLEHELRAGLDVGDADDGLSPARRETLLHNVEFLKHKWFVTRVDAYLECATGERLRFLDEQIKTVFTWAAIDAQLGEPSSNPKPEDSETAAGRMFQQMDRWILAAPADQAARMRAVITDGVVCWLATRDLHDETAAVRREVALRIADELDSGTRADKLDFELSDQQQSRFLANGQLLLESWLFEQSKRFAALNQDQRRDFVDQQIDRFTNWGILELLAGGDGADGQQGVSQMQGLAKFLQLVNTWIERSDEADRPRLRALISHVQQRIIERQFERALTPD